jgi:hypothetical protein
MKNHEPDGDLAELFKAQKKLDAKRTPAFSQLFLTPTRSQNLNFNWFRISLAGTALAAIAVTTWLTWYPGPHQPHTMIAERSPYYNTATESNSTLYEWVPASDCLLVRHKAMQMSQYAPGSDDLLPSGAGSVNSI